MLIDTYSHSLEMFCSWCSGSLNKSALPSTFCWTRMQAEAGQSLDTILKRKELERLTGGGVFYWGIGNPLGTGVTELLRRTPEPEVFFSVMRSRPKPVDTDPTSVLLWTQYYDAVGGLRSLPDHALVMSRGHTATGVAKRCYALVCHSDTPLTLAPLAAFDFSHFRNISGKGGVLGFSQVTANIEHGGHGRKQGPRYEIHLRAALVHPHFIRLAGARRVIDKDRRDIAAMVASHPSPDRWQAFVHKIRNQPRYASQVGENAAKPSR
jgi:hypothetical protein